MRLLYEIGYRFFRMPWEVGPRTELKELVEGGRISPGRAVDLGCGSGDNAIYLAQQGFEVVGVDFAQAGLEKARRKAAAAEVDVAFIHDDLTDLRRIEGTFDLLVDYGVLDDLPPRGRDAYVRSVLPLANPGSHFLLWCFEWSPRGWWERPFQQRMALEPGECERRFGRWFDIAAVPTAPAPGWVPGTAAYLMTRRD